MYLSNSQNSSKGAKSVIDSNGMIQMDKGFKTYKGIPINEEYKKFINNLQIENHNKIKKLIEIEKEKKK